ncbi:MAG: hypothetical protein IMY68_04020, partial [Bacteroidetes bacterium]|nr:hypothetical protein [Bacteroidota bacterium]
NRVDVSLSYTWQQTISLSLYESLKIPGGLSALLANLMLEATSRPVFGSILFALLLAVVFFTLKTIFRKESGKPHFYPLLIASLIPFIISFAHYRLPFELLTSVAAGLLLGMLYSFCLPRNLWLRSLCSFIAAIVVFIVAGVPGLLVLLQVLIIQVLLSRRYKDLILLIPILILPLLYLPFNLAVSIKQAYLGSILVSEYDEIPRAFYFCLTSPVLLLLGFSIGNFVLSKYRVKHSLFFIGSSLIIVMSLMVYSTLTSIKEVEKNGYAIIKASFNADWDEVLQLSEETSFTNQIVQFEVNRALYGTGQLLEKMFSYPQQFAENGIFLEGISSSYVSVHTAAFYYDLGFANEARHWATEAQMMLVRHPVVLKQLVISYLAIGQEEAALKYLGVLSGSRLYREWCDHVKTMLEDNLFGDDPDIKRFRINNPTIDFFAGTKEPHQKLKMFYSSNASNNMAFEFLVAGYLLKHNIGGVVALLPQFKKQGYETFPKAVEEALMIYLSRKGSNTSALSGHVISKNTVEEFTEFSKLFAEVDSQAERRKRVSKYKHTYWYYILFSSPYAKN